MNDTECYVGQTQCDCGRGLMDVYLSCDQHEALLDRGVPAVGEGFCCDCRRTRLVKAHLNGCDEFVFAPRFGGCALQLTLF